MMVFSNILDAIQPTLSPLIWDRPHAERPELKPRVAHWITSHIYNILESGGYSKPQEWVKLVLTGSLTTYQYSQESDCDVSIFVNSEKFPEWSRSEMIGLMISQADGALIPGTPYPMQCFVVARSIKPHDLYKKGLRSGYDISAGTWIEPPDHDRDHDVEQQENGFYTYAMQMADKMESLLRYEPDKAVMFWHQIHQRRMRDQTAGKGDFSEANIVYKFLANRGLFPQIAQQSGEYIAKFAFTPEPAPFGETVEPQLHPCPWCGEIHQPGFDSNACPVRLQRLRNMQQQPQQQRGPFEPAPFNLSSWKVTAYEYPPIRPQDLSSPTAIERGFSRPVSYDEFQSLANEGRQRYQSMIDQSMPAGGLDQNWSGLQQHAWNEVQQPWGGATIDAHNGQPYRGNADVYALTVKEPGMETHSIPIGSNAEQFAGAMNHAKDKFRPILERAHHALGVFRDDDKGMIDFDPSLIVNNRHDVETIGAHTNAVGGAYHFQSGNGYWPPHVPDQPSPQPAQGITGPTPTME